jgi:hypothetical protein
MPPTLPLPSSSLTGVTLTATSGNNTYGPQIIPLSSLSLGANSVQITDSNILAKINSGDTITPSLQLNYASGLSVVSTAGAPYVPPPPASLTTSGLILNYNINDTSSYSGTGTTITDLRGNSNATIANNPIYTSTGGGYLTFNGTNQYLVTNTSLASKLSPPTTSKVISIFVWVYPMDNGVIVAELGTSAPNANWHDSQIEMVAGKLRFSVWNNGTGFESTIPTPLNAWYYVGFTYDGTTTLTAYVNGQVAGRRTNYSRITPNSIGQGLFYSVASMDGTNLGDGTSANMRFGGMQVYNIALTDSNVLTNYDAQKSRFGLS